MRELEEQADRIEQYTRRSNLLFSGLPETGVGEDTEENILAVINDKMEMRPPSDFIGHRAVAPARTAKRREAHPICDRPLHQ